MREKEAILQRRTELIKELTEEPQIRTRTGVKSGAIYYPIRILPIMCLSILPEIFMPDPTPW